MIYCRFAINCDICMFDEEDYIKIYHRSGGEIIAKSEAEAIDICLKMRDNGTHIPNYVFERLSED